MASYSRGKDAIRVGITTVLAGCAFLTLFGYSTNRSLTSDHSDLLIRLTTADGLRKGDAVFYRGVQVGEVKALRFDSAGAVVVHTTLTQEVPLTRDASAELVAVDIFGRQSVVLVDGSPAAGRMLDGDTIRGGAAATLTDRVETLSRQASRLLGDTTVDLVRTTLGEVDMTTRDLATLARTVTDLLAGQRQALDAATTSAATIAQNIAAATDSSAIRGMREELEAATGRLAALAARIDTTTATAARILARLESGDGTAARLLNDAALYENVVASLGSLDALLKDLKENPKRYISISVF